MTGSLDSRILTAATLVLLATTAVDAGAQTCRGMPRGGGIGFVAGSQFLGSTYGVALSKGVIGVGFNSLSGNDRVTSWDANLRFTLAKGSKLQWCPSIGFEFRNDNMDVSDGSKLTARTGTAAAGLGLGYELEAYKGIAVIPFVSVDYHFTAVVFSLDTPDSGDNDELSGDTLSHFNIQYGALAKYKSFYAGFAADRFSDSNGRRPYRTRLIVGLAFGGGGKSSRAAPVPRPAAIRAAGRQ